MAWRYITNISSNSAVHATVRFQLFMVLTLRSEESARNFSRRYFQMRFLNKNVLVLVTTSLNFVPDGLINHTPAWFSQGLRAFYGIIHFCIPVTWQWARWRLKSPTYRLFTQVFVQAQIKETSTLRVTGFSGGNSPVTATLSAHRASNVENVSGWWCFHITSMITNLPDGNMRQQELRITK